MTPTETDGFQNLLGERVSYVASSVLNMKGRIELQEGQTLVTSLFEELSEKARENDTPEVRTCNSCGYRFRQGEGCNKAFVKKCNQKDGETGETCGGKVNNKSEEMAASGVDSNARKDILKNLNNTVVPGSDSSNKVKLAPHGILMDTGTLTDVSSGDPPCRCNVKDCDGHTRQMVVQDLGIISGNPAVLANLKVNLHHLLICVSH